MGLLEAAAAGEQRARGAGRRVLAAGAPAWSQTMLSMPKTPTKSSVTSAVFCFAASSP